MNASKNSAGIIVPSHQGLYYGGKWHDSEGEVVSITNPATGEELSTVVWATESDVNSAVIAANEGFNVWRNTSPIERTKILYEMAARVRKHGAELTMLDSANSGNPICEMQRDAEIGAMMADYFAGLTTEIKGTSVPVGPDAVNFSVREPVGVVVRLLPFNHPLMFCVSKAAAILAAGNSVIVKPSEQAPLSSLRLAELLEDLFPAGVFNVLSGDRTAAAALTAHEGVAGMALVGSVGAGQAVMRAAAEGIKPVLLELGGKNALIGYPDADVDEVADAVIAGMNFGWCGQSCGSTSRAFLHADIYDQVLEKVVQKAERHKPGMPTDPETTMGAIISNDQYENVVACIEKALLEGARLVTGGKRPDDPELKNGNFMLPTILEVTSEMTIARHEVFGPVLSIFRWDDSEDMIKTVNDTEYGLTCSIWTNDLSVAHRTAQDVEVGFVWINEVGRHFLGAPFGGYKKSGIGREECREELLAFTQEKNIHVRLKPR